MSKLSERQRDILSYIKKQLLLKGYPPSVREIGKAVGLRSSSTVHSHLNTLEKQGYLKRDPSKPRAIELMGKNLVHREIINVPIVGKVTAGTPILAVENIEDYFPIPRDFAHSSDDLFMLQVRGESMIGAGIFDGDHLLVQRQNSADNGEIVVAMIEDEVTVKRFYRYHDHIKLQPENPVMEPIIVTDVSILGKVVGVFRRL
jgi:repressor LexA